MEGTAAAQKADTRRQSSAHQGHLGSRVPDSEFSSVPGAAPGRRSEPPRTGYSHCSLSQKGESGMTHCLSFKEVKVIIKKKSASGLSWGKPFASPMMGVSGSARSPRAPPKGPRLSCTQFSCVLCRTWKAGSFCI